MGQRVSKLAVIDVGTVQIRVLEVGDMRLVGECNRCGKCCYDCVHLVQDSFLDDALTQPIYACGIGFEKPMRCALFPLPWDTRPEGCGFSWENK